MMIALYVAILLVGLGLSAFVHLRERKPQAHVKLPPMELHFIAALVSGAGAGLAWGSVYGVLILIVQALAGVALSTKLRKS